MNKDPNSCVKNCKGRILNKARGVYCRHIERKLPRLNRQSIKAIRFQFIDELSGRDAFSSDRVPELELIAKLSKAGLSAHEIELIMCRFIDKRPMSEIVIEQGWLSVNSANHYLRRALKILRNGGFKL